MNLRKGVWAVVALFAVYAALYWHHVITAAMPLDAQFSYFVASCSVICMALGLLLSARPRAVETSFGGLDRMYKLHKYLGIAAMALFIAHYATVPGGPDEDVAATAAVSVEDEALPAEPPGEEEEEELPIDLFGMIAMVGFTLLIVITLNRKIPYHRWIATHRFMGVFFAVVGIHVSMVLYDGEDIPFFSAPGMFLALVLLAGLAGGFYRRFLYPRKEKRRFTLAEVNSLERATELVLRPNDEMFSFEAGQFAFITVDADGFREAHPFTISSGAKEERLRFTIKVLGGLHPQGARKSCGGRRCRRRGSLWTVQSPWGFREAGMGCRGNRDHAVSVRAAHDGTGARQDRPALLLRARGKGSPVFKRNSGAGG